MGLFLVPLFPSVFFAQETHYGVFNDLLEAPTYPTG